MTFRAMVAAYRISFFCSCDNTGELKGRIRGETSRQTTERMVEERGLRFSRRCFRSRQWWCVALVSFFCFCDNIGEALRCVQ
ncbi:hypothetical protein EJ03DRAFT_27716 [Teratosphaeria nubilosa]|uniref:Uncharacterized protein n=1 Tax=Teratosphaeria nubilosa TaxID=161662 RepID=A0A6G1KVL0_9PEZI|nr:hypothetical protein EJ03DRAFT_27716 [Teratosphaeria nubilosa]